MTDNGPTSCRSCDIATRSRLAAHDAQLIDLSKEVTAARMEAQGAHKTSKLVLGEIKQVRVEIREAEERRIRECELRHKHAASQERQAASSSRECPTEGESIALSKAKTAMWSALGAIALAAALAVVEMLKAWR